MSVEKTNLKVVKQNVGIDISKDDFKVCFYHRDSNGRQFIKGSRTFKNTLTGFKEFYKWVEKKRSMDVGLHFTVEATGVYYENLVHFIADQKDTYVSVVLPNQSKAFAKSLNLKTKTDEVDARMLGQMGLERALKKWEPISNKMLLIKQLTRERVNLLDEKVALGNKLHALQHSFNPSKQVIQRLKKRLELIKKQLQQIEQQIQQAVQADDELNDKISKICKIKGLGLITVATIIAETDGFALFTNRSQLISYAGYDVVQRESGSSIKGKTRISKKGNRFIRRALYFPALSLVKHETRFRQIFDRVLSRSFIKMKAYVAVQRKALILIYTLFKNGQDYDPNFLNQQYEHQNKQTMQANV